MKQYMLSIYSPDGPPPPPEILDTVMRDVAVVRREMQEAGIWIFAGGLYPSSTATVIRPRDGELLTTDGPYVEGKEHIGGLCIIKADDLDAALGWGRKMATAIGVPIEVRPLREEHRGQ